MEKWVGRVALVTGASSGIGRAICEALVKSGMKVVAAARRVEKIEEIVQGLRNEKGSLMGIKCDISKDDDVYRLFDKIKKTYGGVDVCINNAGIGIANSLLDGTPEEWRETLDVNVVGLCLCTKLSVASMRERGVDDGHIIQISSVGGHSVLNFKEFHFYMGTKFAVRALTEGLRQELREGKSHIRVSSISPAYVRTEFMGVAYRKEDFVASPLADHLAQSVPLQSEDIAATAIHILSAPPHVEINDVIIRPTEGQE